MIGNISSVFIEGSIVYRDRKPQSVTIHRLLEHLEQKGITFCPKHLGFDDTGREMLSYINGSTIKDYPQVSLITKKIEIVKKAALMLREFHDATVDFNTQSDDIWFLRYDGNLPKEVICHNDFAPYNVTFENDLPIGLIDFDMHISDFFSCFRIGYPPRKFVFLRKTRQAENNSPQQEKRFVQLHTSISFQIMQR
jgi:hypothetical protein